jgi:hypothetical protein
MSCRFYHIGGISPRNSVTSSAKNFEGRLQQLVINGERILNEAHLKQIEYEGYFLMFILEMNYKMKILAHGRLCVSSCILHITPYIPWIATIKSIQHHRYLLLNKNDRRRWLDHVQWRKRG